jgi:hypothetical protein
MVHKIKKKTPKDIDVFWYFEEVLIKKDLDTDDWYKGRTNQLILNLLNSVENDVIGSIEGGEGIPRATAKKAVDIFRKGIEKELKEHPDYPYDVTQGEYD